MSCAFAGFLRYVSASKEENQTFLALQSRIFHTFSTSSDALMPHYPSCLRAKACSTNKNRKKRKLLKPWRRWMLEANGSFKKNAATVGDCAISLLAASRDFNFHNVFSNLQMETCSHNVCRIKRTDPRSRECWRRLEYSWSASHECREENPRFWGAVASLKGSNPPNFPFSFPFLLVTPVIWFGVYQQVAV